MLLIDFYKLIINKNEQLLFSIICLPSSSFTKRFSFSHVNVSNLQSVAGLFNTFCTELPSFFVIVDNGL